MNDMSLADKEFTDTVEGLIRKISPLLTGHKSGVQGAVLGHLMALWLSAHYAEPDQQEALWDSLMGHQADLIRRLVKVDREQKRAG